MPVKTSKHASVVFKDGAGSPLTYTASPTPMDLKIDGLEGDLDEAIKVMNNGVFLELVDGPQKEFPWSLTIYHDGKLIDGSNGKPLNAVLKQGAWAAATTGDPGAVVWTLAEVVCTLTRGSAVDTVTIRNSRIVAGFELSPDGNKITISGIAYGKGSGAGNEAISISST